MGSERFNSGTQDFGAERKVREYAGSDHVGAARASPKTSTTQIYCSTQDNIP